MWRVEARRPSQVWRLRLPRREPAHRHRAVRRRPTPSAPPPRRAPSRRYAAEPVHRVRVWHRYKIINKKMSTGRIIPAADFNATCYHPHKPNGGAYAKCIYPDGETVSVLSPSHTCSSLLTPSHTFSHLITPPHASSRLLTPSHTFSHLLTPPHASSRLLTGERGALREVRVAPLQPHLRPRDHEGARRRHTQRTTARQCRAPPPEVHC